MIFNSINNSFFVSLYVTHTSENVDDYQAGDTSSDTNVCIGGMLQRNRSVSVNYKGRRKEVDVMKDSRDPDKLLDNCLNYSCTNMCGYSKACISLAKDITLVHTYRSKLFGTPEISVPSATRQRFIYDVLDDNKVVSQTPDKRKIHFRYFIDHQQICRRAFLAITGLSRVNLYRARRAVLKGHESAQVPKGVDNGGGIRNLSKDTCMAMAWLRGVAERLGQYLPNANETRLPFGTKTIVHMYYVAEMRLRGIAPLKYARFVHLWSSSPDMSTIKLTKKKGSFAQCDTCADFAKEMSKAKDNATADDIKSRWNVHVAHITRCRQIYYENRDLAYARPDKSLCIIADIMDQSKTTIPHHRRKQKRWANMNGLRQCVMGVKTHGVRMDHYVANMRVGTGGGSNFTIECLSRTLRKVAAMDGRNGKVPPRLYLQMDNCSGDNKNYAVVGFLNWLVREGVFSTVEVGYLPVGHTHEDIDQGFSVLSRHLRRVDALSHSSYEREVRAAFRQTLDKPDIEYVNVKRDWKAWITQPGAMYDKRSGFVN